MPTDKTGAEATVSAAEGKYTIAVDGETVGLAAVADRGNQRVFYHTEVEEQFGGRGLATILVAEALAATRADGKRVVPLCPMVAADWDQLHRQLDGYLDAGLTKFVIRQAGAAPVDEFIDRFVAELADRQN